MIMRTIVIPNRYLDSVFLMAIAGRLKERSGIGDASAVMGTPANKDLLRESGLLDDQAKEAGPADLVISLRAETDEDADQALQDLEDMLRGQDAGSGPPRRPPGGAAAGEEGPPVDLEEALARSPKASLVLISLPGEYVRHEALKALDLGLHPFIFSDNVSVEDEVELKTLGRERGLLVMGPDCGTSILDRVALGFANVVPRGPVAIVGASGTGIQELSCLLARHGIGIHQAIGVGGRDLSQAVGGASMIQAIELMDEDPAAELIVLVSKPPHPAVAAAVLERAGAMDTPCLVCFLGGDASEARARGLPFAVRLDLAATMARLMLAREDPMSFEDPGLGPGLSQDAAKLASGLAAGRRFLRGLYSGGTLCEEALLLAEAQGLEDLHSNLVAKGVQALPYPGRSSGNTFLDLGDDHFTRGRPHPMIDFGLRRERMQAEARDPKCAVLLFDLVLGHGAHPDPAGELASTIEELCSPEGPVFVASVTGTDDDPQCATRQRERLSAAGVRVLDHNVEAARFALAILHGLKTDDTGESR